MGSCLRFPIRTLETLSSMSPVLCSQRRTRTPRKPWSSTTLGRLWTTRHTRASQMLTRDLPPPYTSVAPFSRMAATCTTFWRISQLLIRRALYCKQRVTSVRPSTFWQCRQMPKLYPEESASGRILPTGVLIMWSNTYSLCACWVAWWYIHVYAIIFHLKHRQKTPSSIHDKLKERREASWRELNVKPNKLWANYADRRNMTWKQFRSNMSESIDKNDRGRGILWLRSMVNEGVAIGVQRWWMLCCSVGLTLVNRRSVDDVLF